MSQYTKSSSSSSCSVHPFPLDGITSREPIITFDPMDFVQQMWKGFCLPNHDDNRTNVGDNNGDELYEQHFCSASPTTTSKDIPRCIDLTSQITNHNYISDGTVQMDRHRLGSYELDNCDCKDSMTMIISNDSYDDDDNITGDSCSRHQYNLPRNTLIDSVVAEKNEVVDDVKCRDQGDVMIAITSGYTDRMTRVTRGLEYFISALCFIALTMYVIQKLPNDKSISNSIHHSFYLHTKIDYQESSLWRWHLK